jgi:hypothetical protein
MSNQERFLLLWVTAAVAGGLAFLFAGCGDDGGTTKPGLNPQATCVGCHQDKEMLQASADPESSQPPADPGEG